MTLKKHIAKSALDLFFSTGIRRVSMDDISRKASVSKRTLYEFFSDKETLLMQALEESRIPMTERMSKLEKGDYNALEVMLLFNEELMEDPKWICPAFFEDIVRYPKAHEYMLKGKKYFLDKMVQLFKRGVREEVFLPEINFDIISLMVQEHLAVVEPSSIYTKYTHEEVHNTVLLIFMRGICTDAGRGILDRFVMRKVAMKQSKIIVGQRADVIN